MFICIVYNKMKKIIKKFIWCILWLIVVMVSFAPIASYAWWFDGSILSNISNIKGKTNEEVATKVQDTELDRIDPNDSWSTAPSNFTFTRTIASIIGHLSKYLDYAVYVGLVFAVIFLIVNALQIVLASDKWAQMKKFKTNLKYIIIWVCLLTGFYFIIDIFVSLANLFFD